MAAPARPPMPRRVGLAVLTALAVALTVMAVAFAIMAIPLYALAAADPAHGVDRPFIRTGLLRVALPLAVVLGVATGAVVGRWYGRGGRLPDDRGDRGGAGGR